MLIEDSESVKRKRDKVYLIYTREPRFRLLYSPCPCKAYCSL